MLPSFNSTEGDVEARLFLALKYNFWLLGDHLLNHVTLVYIAWAWLDFVS